MGQPTRDRAAFGEDGPDQIDLEVGLNLRRVRLARGISQAELGEALGISFQQIQKYERAANRISASMLVKAARFLGVRTSDLLPPDDDLTPMADFVHRFTEVRGVADVVDAFCAMRNPALRRALLRLMRAMYPTAASAAVEVEGDVAPSRPR